MQERPGSVRPNVEPVTCTVVRGRAADQQEVAKVRTAKSASRENTGRPSGSTAEVRLAKGRTAEGGQTKGRAGESRGDRRRGGKEQGWLRAKWLVGGAP